jgi:hypothetical protein
MVGSPSETKGISRSSDTGKDIDSKWATQIRPKSPSPLRTVLHLAAPLSVLLAGGKTLESPFGGAEVYGFPWSE